MQNGYESFSKWLKPVIKSAIKISEYDRLAKRLQKLYPFEVSADAWILQDDPLLTLALTRKALQLSDCTVDDWSYVWTFQADLRNTGHPFTESVHGHQLRPGHRTYGFLVSREENIVVDIFGTFSSKGEKWSKPVIPFLQDLCKKAATVYTCNDEAQFLEFLDALYVMRQPKVGDLSQPVVDKKPEALKDKRRDVQSERKTDVQTNKPKETVKPSVKKLSVQEYALPLSAIAFVLVSVFYYFI